MADELLTPRQPNGATIVWLHGGALMLGSPADHKSHGVERYVAAGYTVLCLDYPLVPPATVDKIVAYVVAACGHVRSPFATVGHSAGGYLALAAAANLQRKPNAVVSFYGFGSLRWGLEPSYLHLPPADPQRGGVHLYHWCRQQGRWVHEVTGRDPVADADWIERYEPVHRPAEAVPTLLLHGDDDMDVPVDESRKMAAVLARAAIEHSYVEAPGRGHGFDVAEPDWVFDRVLPFLRRRLG